MLIFFTVLVRHSPLLPLKVDGDLSLFLLLFDRIVAIGLKSRFGTAIIALFCFTITGGDC